MKPVKFTKDGFIKLRLTDKEAVALLDILATVYGGGRGHDCFRIYDGLADFLLENDIHDWRETPTDLLGELVFSE